MLSHTRLWLPLGALLPSLLLAPQGCPSPTFEASLEVEGGGSGTVILEFLAVQNGATLQRFQGQAGATFSTEELPEGTYGLRAWLDKDGDGTWDGIWENGGEPTAILGITLPRTDFRLVLRQGPPTPILDDDPQWLELYQQAWTLAEDHIAAGTVQNAFADHYMDEAFSEQIFQWDTCFMTLFGRYGLDAFPVMGSLDNFYNTQATDGYICRVVNESDGQPGGDASDPSEPMINPPLFAWTELLYARQTGDLSRLPRVLPVLASYHAWIDGHVRTDTGLYYTSMLGSGMDNAPRDQAFDAWVDISAQQALARRMEAQLAQLVGNTNLQNTAAQEADRICGDLKRVTWNDAEGFFFDVDYYGRFLTDKTLASIWPLLAGCASTDQASRVIAHLADPTEFWRTHVFPSTAADSPAYDPKGYYWRGGVWAPTNYATIMALAQAGRRDLAREASEKHLRALSTVARSFTPAPGQLAADANGDGLDTLWELYTPDSFAPGTRWDNLYLGRQDFVGWTGLGPIALLLEQIIGLEANAPADSLTWHVTRLDRHGVQGYRFGDQLVSLVAQPRAKATDPLSLEVDTSDAFTLLVELGGVTSSHMLHEGLNQLTLDPTGNPLAGLTVPNGPFPGYAVLGNGRISAVWSEQDGSADPAGLTHFYRGNFGMDLATGGRTRVVENGSLHNAPLVGLDPFFAARAERRLACGGTLVTRALVGVPDALVVVGELVAGDSACNLRIVPEISLKASPHIDGKISLQTLARDATTGALTARFSDGTAVALGTLPAPTGWQAGDITNSQVLTGLTETVGAGNELGLELDLFAAAHTSTPFRWVLASGLETSGALSTLSTALAQTDPLGDASDLWASWSPEQLCGSEQACQTAAANLYAARASSLKGMVPADLTGQFVTNGYPQLYPRDAMMTARAFILTGHPAEAWEIVHDWLGSDRFTQNSGEWYARYNALGVPVDGGSGADYDVPEWDANGYIASLVAMLGPEGLSTTERAKLLSALDFLVSKQDSNGLFLEGGIVEWVGHLPATTMSVWAGLDAGARLADGWGETSRATSYRAAAGRLRGGLIKLFDFNDLRLEDERDGQLLYNTSLLFGPAWGYPAGPLTDASFQSFIEETLAFGGGLRYFEAPGYGQDLFFFTTAAGVEYASILGDLDTADTLYAWMMAYSNVYGLAPERVYADGSGAAIASPLSWCAAEVPVSYLYLEQARSLAGLPVLDGEVLALEARPTGNSVVDGDGAADSDASPVSLYASSQGNTLVLGLTVAGQTSRLSTGTTYSIYLSSLAGTGTARTTVGGQPLTFRVDPTSLAGAVARVKVSPGAGTCVVGKASGTTYLDGACPGFAVGAQGLEVKVDLGVLGLSAPVQAIAVAETSSGEQLLPAHGALLSSGTESTSLVSFEVDASSVAAQLNPAAGVVVTLSGDRAELGAWKGNALALRDDGQAGDRVAGDKVWTVVVRTARGGQVSYKYLIGKAGDGSWAGVEFGGDNRTLWVEDIDGSGRVREKDVYAVRGGSLLDP